MGVSKKAAVEYAGGNLVVTVKQTMLIFSDIRAVLGLSLLQTEGVPKRQGVSEDINLF